MPTPWKHQMSEILLSDVTMRPGQEENLRRLLASRAAGKVLQVGPRYTLCFTKKVEQHPQFPDAKQLTISLEVREAA